MHVPIASTYMRHWKEILATMRWWAAGLPREAHEVAAVVDIVLVPHWLSLRGRARGAVGRAMWRAWVGGTGRADDRVEGRRLPRGKTTGKRREDENGRQGRNTVSDPV